MPALTISPPRPYVKFVETDSGVLTGQGYDFLYGLYRRVGGALSDLNAATLLDQTWAEPGAIGNITPEPGHFTTLSANASFVAGGYVSINPSISSNMDYTIIGDTTPARGTFSELKVTPTTGVNVRLEPAGTIYLFGGTGTSTMDKVNIGSTLPGTGKFSTLQSTGAFSCNGAAVQTSYSIGATLGAYAAGANGLSTAAAMQALVNKVIAMELALKANGICIV